MTQLLELLQQVKTLDGRIPVYEQADIRFEVVDPADLKPNAKYVIRDNLARVNQMRRDKPELYHQPILSEYQGVPVAPPIIEDGNIVDGLHRCWDSLHNGRSIMVARITNTPESLPLVSQPVGWDQVQVLDAAPEYGRDCRELKPGVEDDPRVLRKHFRDFSLLGSSGRRPSLGQSN